MRDNNFEVMKAMNYAYDNPDSREMVKPDEEILKTATKNAYDKKTIEQLCLYASLSSDPNTLALSNEILKSSIVNDDLKTKNI